MLINVFRAGFTIMGALEQTKILDPQLTVRKLHMHPRVAPRRWVKMGVGKVMGESIGRSDAKYSLSHFHGP